MALRLVSHVSGDCSDDDLLEAWLRYYVDLGVTSFNLIVHGTQAENAKLFALKDRFPIVIMDSYNDEFTDEEKKKRVDSVLATMTGQWLLFVDSDEFVEFPFRTIASTIRMLELARGNMLFAPMLQHMTPDGSLNTPEVIDDPFRTLPLCSVSLYEKMGTNASINKFPLFYCTNGTALVEGGNHSPPLGAPTATRSLLGVTHHFKFRTHKLLLRRLDKRIHSSNTFRHESEQYLRYLKMHEYRLPLEDSFYYSRDELFRRDLLRRFTFRSALRFVRRSVSGSIRYGETSS
jgi:Glycosyl transferase family 2